MGGKAKASQRTKNNVRPSSSGRSAGLLCGPTAAATAGAPLFTGVAAAKGSLLASLAQEPALPASLALAFKKLSKKDPITKIKGLSELSQLVCLPGDAAAHADAVAHASAADVVSALPAWTAHYRLLAVDADHRVRDHAQQCQWSVMRRCGRQAAPYLRQLVPVWLLSAHEPHAPAAHRAQAALQETFPGDKLPSALVYCREEIAALLHHILTTPCTANKIPATSDDDSTDMSAWRAVSALGAFEQLMECVGGQGDEWAQQRVAALLADKEFWKLAGHADHAVRCAWYSGMGRVGALRLLGASAARVTARLVQPAEQGRANQRRWEALVTLMEHHQEWYSWVDKELLETRVMNALETGGWGCARSTLALMVRLLCRLPHDALTAKFYSRLFDALLAGMECKSVCVSASERSWWSVLVRECVRHAARQSHGRRVTHDAIQRWVAHVAQRHDKGREHEHWVCVTAKSLSWLALEWLKELAMYGEHLNTLWDATTRLPIEVATVQIHALLLTTMCTCLDDKRGIAFGDNVKKVGVTFADECDKTNDDKITGGDKDTSESIGSEMVQEQASVEVREKYTKALRQCAAAATAHWLIAAAADGSLCLAITALLPLLRCLDAPPLWAAVARHCDAPSTAQLYWRRLGPWLREQPTASIAQLLVMLMQHIEQDERERIFADFDQLDDVSMQCVLSLSVPAAASWWRGSARAAQALARAAERALQGDHAHMRIVTHALIEWSVSDAVLSAISAAITEHLSAVQLNSDVDADVDADEDAAADAAPALQPACELAGRLADALAAKKGHRSGEFILALARLLLYTQPGGSMVSTAGWHLAANGARKVLQAMDSEQRAVVELQVHNMLQDYLRNSVCESVPAPVVRRVSRVWSLLLWSQSPPSLSRDAATASRVITAALRADIVSGVLACPLVDDHVPMLQIIIEEAESNKNETEELTKETLVLFINELLLRAYTYNIVIDKLGAKREWTDEENNSNEGDKGERVGEGNGKKIDDKRGDDLTNRTNVNNPQNHSTDDTDKARCKQLNVDVGNKNNVKDDNASNVDEIRSTNHSAGSSECLKIDVTNAEALSDDVTSTEARDWLIRHGALLLHDHALLKALLRHYTHSPYYPVLQRTEHTLDEVCQRALRDDGVGAPVRGEVEEQAANMGCYWAAAAAAMVADQHDGDAATVDTTDGFDTVDIAVEKTAVADAAVDTVDSANSAVAVETPVTSVDNIAVVDETAAAVGASNVNLTANGYFHMLQMRALHASDTFALSVQWAVCMRCAHASISRLERASAAALGAAAAVDDEHQRTDMLLAIYYQHPAALHVDSPETLPSWSTACAASCTARYLATLVRARGWLLPPPHWDLATLAMCAYVTAAHKARQHMHNTKVSLVWCAALRLTAAVHAFVQAVPARAQQLQPSPHVAALPAEWRHLFAPHLTPLLQDILLLVLEEYTSPELPYTVVCVLEALEPLLSLAVPGDAGGRARLAGAAATALGARRHSAVHALAYTALYDAASQLARDDEEALAAWGAAAAAEDNTLERPTLTAALLATPLQAALDQQGAGASCGLPLLAVALARLTLGSDDKDIGGHYQLILDEHPVTGPLLSLALQWLPAAAAAHAHAGAPPPALGHLFTEDPEIHVTDHVSADVVSALWCRALCCLLSGACAARARAWVSAAAARDRRAVERLTRAYIRPHCVKLLVQQLTASSDQWDDDITMHATTGEITVSLMVDESRVELVISLPELYPLVGAQLRAGARAAAVCAAPLAAAHSARAGGVGRALRLWADAVRRRVSSQPPCYVCYSRLHPVTGQLPAAHCHQCNNKFHSQCIRKWFQSSQKSNCPLCRSVF